MRPKLCKSCKEKFTPVRKIQPCCTIPCEIDLAIAREKKRKKKKHLEQKKGIKTIAQWLNETEAAFRRYVRAFERLYYAKQGMAPMCISCGTSNPSIQYCAGHYKTKGAFSEYRLDKENCHLQCNHRCNKQLSGNINGTKDSYGYKEGYVIRYGEEKAAEILARLEKHIQPQKYTAGELEAKKKEFNRMARELEKELFEIGVIR